MAKAFILKELRSPESSEATKRFKSLKFNVFDYYGSPARIPVDSRVKFPLSGTFGQKWCAIERNFSVAVDTDMKTQIWTHFHNFLQIEQN